MRQLKTPVSEADTLPHQQSMAGLVVKTSWGGAGEGFLFARHHEAIPKEELISHHRRGK